MTGPEMDALAAIVRHIQMTPLLVMLGIVVIGLGLAVACRMTWDFVRRRRIGFARRHLRRFGAAGLVLAGLVTANGLPVPVDACRVAAQNPAILSEVKVTGRMTYSPLRAREVCRSAGVPIGGERG